jgi:hypothetical protein
MTDKEFVKMVAEMPTEEEYGDAAPPSEDWISEMNGLIVAARMILNACPAKKKGKK